MILEMYEVLDPMLLFVIGEAIADNHHDNMGAVWNVVVFRYVVICVDDLSVAFCHTTYISF